MSKLSKETTDRIEKEAEAYAETHGDHLSNIKEYSTHNDILGAYNAAATEWAGRAQPVIDLLDQIGNGPFPINQSEMEEWLLKTKRDARSALAKYKEVGNG